uniref:Uncharacterized protein n=1 Tax=Rhizophora mucronata TaxID=61149 RepID=A0A2P2Q1Z3_RHIMU
MQHICVLPHHSMFNVFSSLFSFNVFFSTKLPL